MSANYANLQTEKLKDLKLENARLRAQRDKLLAEVEERRRKLDEMRLMEAIWRTKLLHRSTKKLPFLSWGKIKVANSLVGTVLYSDGGYGVAMTV
jgi:hypothetical protein